MKNIFILAMDEFQKEQLATLANAQDYHFHQVLDVSSLVESEEIEFNQLLVKAREQIEAAEVPVDAIIAQWDFPTSVLVPILSREFGVSSPSLESVLKCEHKLWSRMEQKEVVPEVVPNFNSFDPFSQDPLGDIGLPFPFWMKPVKTFSSQLGFLIKNEEEFYNALETIRDKIGRLGNSFNEALEKVMLPPKLRGAGGNTCLAEQIIQGEQVAPEGTVYQGEVAIHGFFDMNKGDGGTKLDRFEYPSTASQELKEAMTDICERLLEHINFDNGCFNVEFMWDAKQRKLWLIEVNTRISQSHSPMFVLVDGMSNHEVAIDVAMGKKPSIWSGKGPHNVAAKFILMHDQDGVVTRVPSAERLAAIRAQFPDMRLKLDVAEGDRLSEMVNQDAYHFTLGELYLGADSHEKLLSQYEKCLAALAIEVSPVSEVHASEYDTQPSPTGRPPTGDNGRVSASGHS